MVYAHERGHEEEVVRSGITQSAERCSKPEPGLIWTVKQSSMFNNFDDQILIVSSKSAVRLARSPGLDARCSTGFEQQAVENNAN